MMHANNTTIKRLAGVLITLVLFGIAGTAQAIPLPPGTRTLYVDAGIGAPGYAYSFARAGNAGFTEEAKAQVIIDCTSAAIPGASNSCLAYAHARASYTYHVGIEVAPIFFTRTGLDPSGRLPIKLDMDFWVMGGQSIASVEVFSSLGLQKWSVVSDRITRSMYPGVRSGEGFTVTKSAEAILGWATPGIVRSAFAIVDPIISLDPNYDPDLLDLITITVSNLPMASVSDGDLRPSANSVPEPEALALFSIGTIGILAARRRKKDK